MGRAPCCDKANVKKGPWSPEEDAKLKAYIEQHGTGGNWIALPQKIGLRRCGKSCRLRWLNYLRPNLKHGGFSEEEDNIICSLYISIGSRWSIIAAQLPGRTDNDIKNYWNTRLKKKFLGKQRKEQQARRGSCLRQEMKRANGNTLVSDNNNQTPYWPELPAPAPAPALIPYSNQEPCLNDHASIRKLLIKLGGRFSDDDDQTIYDETNLQFPADISSSQQLYEQYNIVNNMPSSSTMDASIRINSAQFAPTHYNTDGAGLYMSQLGQSCIPVELHDMVCSNPQRVDALDFLNGEDMDSTRIGTCYAENISWGEMMSSMVYPSCFQL